MKKKMKHCFKITTALVITLMLILITATAALAMTPEFTSGMLLLKADDEMSRTYTGYWSIVCGVGTWYYTNQYVIKNYCWNYKGQPYYDTLAYYGYTLVTSDKLANVIRLDEFLGLNYVSQQVVDQIRAALDADYAAASFPKNQGEYWDPYNDWKWRSAYMEERYAENGSSTRIMANCWGTADYLTRSFKWAEAYPSNKAWALSDGMDQWAASFPHIYLDGYPSAQYSIDNDLTQNSWRFHYKASVPAELGPAISYILNSFDVIRMSTNPGYDDLFINGLDIGQNKHCVAYLCTDAEGKYWFYQKGNFGATSSAPYGIWAFGLDPNWQYENHYRSLFSHDDDFKLNMADSYEQNWYGITP